MKRLTFIIAFSCLFCSNIFAQSPERNFKHEAKINMGAIIFSTIDVSYEYLINDYSGVGMDVLVPFQKGYNNVYYRFMPYYRLYFGNKKAAGFFAEVNIAAMQMRSYTKHDDFGFGTGIAIGGKFLTKSNFLFEVYGGLGRDFANDRMYPRCGVTFGKRF